jgi:hypothetical protein
VLLPNVLKRTTYCVYRFCISEDLHYLSVPDNLHTFIGHKVINGVKCILILLIYIDNLFPIGNKVLTDDFERWISNYFKITPPGDIHYFLGI